jgi:hypothetical protein
MVGMVGDVEEPSCVSSAMYSFIDNINEICYIINII